MRTKRLAYPQPCVSNGRSPSRNPRVRDDAAIEMSAFPMAMLVLNSDLSLKFQTRSWSTITGIPKEKSLGRRWLEALECPDSTELARCLSESAQGGRSGSSNFRLSTIEGPRLARWSWSATEHRIVLSLEEMLDNRDGEPEFNKFSVETRPAGLVDRVSFIENINLALWEANIREFRVGIVMIDLNRFKSAAYCRRHSTAAKVLETVGTQIINNLSPGYTASHIDGDEFAILCPLVSNAAEVLKIAEGIRTDVSQQVECCQLRPSVGIALTSRSDLDGEALLGSAGLARNLTSKSALSPEMNSPGSDAVNRSVGSFCVRVMDDLTDVGTKLSTYIAEDRRREFAGFDHIVDSLDLLIDEARRIAAQLRVAEQ